MYEYEMIPFWSFYKVLFKGNKQLIIEIFLNFALMIPIGVLWKIYYIGQHNLLKLIHLSIIIELLIEMMQLLFKRGLFEWDDIITGGLGAAFGYIFIETISRLYQKFSK